MYLNLQESVLPPHLTICSTEFSTHLDDSNFHTKFMRWFHEQYPCSRNHFDYSYLPNNRVGPNKRVGSK